MRVLTEAKLFARKRALEEQRRELRRKHRQITAELRVLDSLSADLDDLPAEPLPPPVAAQSNMTGGVRIADLLSRPQDDTAAEKSSDAPFFRQPASENSPISKVQIPVWELVTMRPGIHRILVQKSVADQVGTSIDSVRETIRRMVRAGKLRQDNHRLFPVAPPEDDADNGEQDEVELFGQ